MVNYEPCQSYKVPLKNNGQSIIEHNLVTIYLNLEWPDDINDNPNLIIHILDKKTSSKPCKNEGSMSYFQQNQSSLLVNSIHHHHHQQQPNYGSAYQQKYHHHYHHSSVINNEPPTTTTTITTGDHNDVSSTTTTVVFSALQPPMPPPAPPLPSSSTSHMPVQQIKSEAKTQLSPIYRRQQTPNSPPICSSTNQPYLSSQHVIQTPSTNMDTQSNIQMSPTLKAISPTSSTNIPSKQTLTHVIDVQQSPTISSCPLTASSAIKAFVCTCLKPHPVHDKNCPALTFIKQQSNTTLTSQTIICRPPVNRTLAQRAAVASQIRTNRAVSMTAIKEQGQTSSSSTTLLPFPISNIKTLNSLPNITTIISQKQPNISTINKPIIRQRSIGSVNPRQKKKRLVKQISLPNETNQEQSTFFNQINLNDSKQQQPSAFMIEEENITSPNPTVKLVSPFSIQTKVSNSEIDQTIDDVINGKGDIAINDLPQLPPKTQPSSQLVWVQNGTVTTKTWLSPLYQKQQQQHQQQQQQQQQTDYDPLTSTLTHQDVVNIAQQVVFPTTSSEQNQINTGLQLPPPPPITTNNSKKRNRSKSTNNTTPKRTRNRKVTLNRPHSTNIASSQQEIIGKATTSSSPPITPTLNLINKPVIWSNISTSESVINKPNLSMLDSDHHHLTSYNKNDSWPTPCIENVDSMLDEFQLVSIDEQRIHSNHPLDFDLSTDSFPSKTTDRFGSSTPPPPSLLSDNHRYSLTSNEKFLNNSSITNPRLITGDLDGVYEHYLNPYSSSIWQENQVTSSVLTPQDFQSNHYPMQHQQDIQQQQQQQQQQYYSSQNNEEQFDPYSQSHGRLLFDVQS